MRRRDALASACPDRSAQLLGAFEALESVPLSYLGVAPLPSGGQRWVLSDAAAAAVVAAVTAFVVVDRAPCVTPGRGRCAACSEANIDVMRELNLPADVESALNHARCGSAWPQKYLQDLAWWQSQCGGRWRQRGGAG